MECAQHAAGQALTGLCPRNDQGMVPGLREHVWNQDTLLICPDLCVYITAPAFTDP